METSLDMFLFLFSSYCTITFSDLQFPTGLPIVMYWWPISIQIKVLLIVPLKPPVPQLSSWTYSVLPLATQLDPPEVFSQRNGEALATVSGTGQRYTLPFEALVSCKILPPEGRDALISWTLGRYSRPGCSRVFGSNRVRAVISNKLLTGILPLLIFLWLLMSLY